MDAAPVSSDRSCDRSCSSRSYPAQGSDTPPDKSFFDAFRMPLPFTRGPISSLQGEPVRGAVKKICFRFFEWPGGAARPFYRVPRRIRGMEPFRREGLEVSSFGGGVTEAMGNIWTNGGDFLGKSRRVSGSEAERISKIGIDRAKWWRSRGLIVVRWLSCCKQWWEWCIILYYLHIRTKCIGRFVILQIFVNQNYLVLDYISRDNFNFRSHP